MMVQRNQRFQLRIAALASCLLWCCGCPVAMVEDSKVEESGKEAAEQPVKTIAFEEITFTDPAVREALVGMEKEARKIAGSDWQHVPWHWRGTTNSKPERHFIFATQWGSRPTGKPYCDCERTFAPCHLIDLIAFPRHPEIDRPKQVYSVSVIARSYPAGKGWAADIRYSNGYLRGGWTNEDFRIAFYHEDWPVKSAQPKFVIPCHGHCFTVERAGGTSGFGFLQSPASQRPTARAYLGSAKSLRDTGLRALDEIESTVRKVVEGGNPADELLALSKSRGVEDDATDDPERARFAPSSAAKPLTPLEKEEILQEVKIQLGRQRTCLREDYLEMYAAMQRAFPVNKVLPRGAK